MYLGTLVGNLEYQDLDTWFVFKVFARVRSCIGADCATNVCCWSLSDRQMGICDWGMNGYFQNSRLNMCCKMQWKYLLLTWCFSTKVWWCCSTKSPSLWMWLSILKCKIDAPMREKGMWECSGGTHPGLGVARRILEHVEKMERMENTFNPTYSQGVFVAWLQAMGQPPPASTGDIVHKDGASVFTSKAEVSSQHTCHCSFFKICLHWLIWGWAWHIMDDKTLQHTTANTLTCKCSRQIPISSVFKFRGWHSDGKQGSQ